MGNLILKNCKTPQNNIVDIKIENGKIKKIKKTLQKSEQTTDNIIDIKQKTIIPGLIDTHVHLRDPGLTHKETWKTGTQAAAHGGYTTIIDMPNTKPQTNTKKNFLEKKQTAQKKSYTDYAIHAGVKTKKDVDEILPLKPASYKIFMDLYENEDLDKMFSHIRDTEKPLTLHCEDKTLVEHNTNTLKKDPENLNRTIAYSYARSPLAEIIAVNRAIELAKKYNLQIHLCHISTTDTLELVREAKNRINITIEATPHHLFLDNTTYNTYGTKAKTNPPLRDKNHNITIDNLQSFDSIATDHAPHTIDEKEKDTWTSAAGIPSLETTLKLLLTQVNKNKITLDDLIQKTSTRPAEIFKIPSKGKIKENYDADITVLDMKKTGKINTDEFYTKAKYTPFENMQYHGDCVMTINRGNITSQDNEVYKHDAKYIY